jgi:hypothetical protein
MDEKQQRAPAGEQECSDETMMVRSLATAASDNDGRPAELADETGIEVYYLMHTSTRLLA